MIYEIGLAIGTIIVAAGWAGVTLKILLKYNLDENLFTLLGVVFGSAILFTIVMVYLLMITGLI